MEGNIMVSVLCTAYNHEKFIKDAIEGVVSQKTNFKYELIIHDDASTDGTAKVIKEYENKYPEVIRTVIQTENQYQRCNIYQAFLFPIIKGQYVAFCEGDDFWTDPDKLQKQVDILETHGTYSMCMHNAVKQNYETGMESLLDTFPEDGVYSQAEQVRAGLGTDFPAFASYMVRAGLLDGMPDFFLASKVLDYPLRQYFANCGEVYYFKKPMSVYRVSTPQSYMKKTSESQLFYNNYTVEMIRFFENFNRYTLGVFSDILKCKIVSDYFGFCLSIPEKEGITKALELGLDASLAEECYQCLSPKHLDSSILELSRQTGQRFIYGTGRLAPVCKAQMELAGIGFEGFVVSDGQMKAELAEGRKVYYLSEVLKMSPNPGFVLAVQPINAGAVEEVLKRNHIENYCMPYRAGNY